MAKDIPDKPEPDLVALTIEEAEKIVKKDLKTDIAIGLCAIPAIPLGFELISLENSVARFLGCAGIVAGFIAPAGMIRHAYKEWKAYKANPADYLRENYNIMIV